jgi:phage baseplate assembly protein gpV
MHTAVTMGFPFALIVIPAESVGERLTRRTAAVPDGDATYEAAIVSMLTAVGGHMCPAGILSGRTVYTAQNVRGHYIRQYSPHWNNT